MNTVLLIVMLVLHTHCVEAAGETKSPDVSKVIVGENAASLDPAKSIPDETLDWVIPAEKGSKKINIIAGNSRVMRFNRAISRVAVSNPDIADVLVLNATEILINTKSRGAANLIVWDAYQQDIFTYQLTVTGDPTPLKRAIESIKPDQEFDVFSTEKGFVVKGNVDTVETQKQILDTAKAFGQESVSLVTVKEAKQILLQILFIEVDRSTEFEFGIDGSYAGKTAAGVFLPGGTATTLAALTTTALEKSVETNIPERPLFAAGFSRKNKKFVQTFVKALEAKNKLKVIAKPNLLVRDGEEASFLVGGEFPVPVVTSNTVDVSYKEFGTRLIYKPEIISDSKIRMHIEGEVSQLDFANGVTIQSIQIPALSSRKTKTVAELESDQSLIIAGLIQQRRTETNSGTPILRKIPLLGRLFSSTENTYSDVELIVIVTPRIVDVAKESFDLKDLPADDNLRLATESFKDTYQEERASAINKALNRYVLNTGKPGPKHSPAALPLKKVVPRSTSSSGETEIASVASLPRNDVIARRPKADKAIPQPRTPSANVLKFVDEKGERE